jgi:RimJ/RimL family protein N-acetyltransferase
MVHKGSRVAAIYDIHGNLPALEAVLAGLESVSPDLIVVGGDVVAGSMPAEVMDRLVTLGETICFIEDTELRLLEKRHAKELTDLTDRNREYLRAWLPWVDASRTLEDRKNFIRGALTQFAQNKGFVAGIWYEGRLAGVIGYDPIDWENRTTELGYWLGEEYQGNGLVTAA